MEQQAMIENLRWWSQVYLWLAIGIPILGAIAGGLLNLKRHYIEGKVRELSAQLTEQALREVQAQQQPRTLTRAQVHALLPQLHNGPKGKVKIEAPAGDAEADQFGDQFYAVLMAGGWSMERSARVQYLGELPVGLQLEVSRADMAPHSEFLLKSLRAIGFEVSYRSNRNVPEGVVLFTVGQKPWPSSTKP